MDSRDNDIAIQIRTAIVTNLRVDSRRLRVEVEDGRVTLVGPVASNTLRELADELAWQVPGVRDVINRLTVEPPAMMA